MYTHGICTPFYGTSAPNGAWARPETSTEAAQRTTKPARPLRALPATIGLRPPITVDAPPAHVAWHACSHRCHRGRPARTCTLLRCRHHRRRHRRRRLRRWPKHVRADPNAAGTQRSHHRHRRHHRPLSDGATLPATRLRRRRRLDPAALPEPGQHPSRPCRSGTYTTASRKRKTRWGTTAAPMEPTAAPAAPSPEMPAVAAAPANGQLHV